MSQETLAQLQTQYDQLEKDYKAKRATLEKQIANARKAEQAGAIAQIRALMNEHGIKAADLGAANKSNGARKSVKVEAKYRGPNGETWTGRGRQPRWIGADREKFRINP